MTQLEKIHINCQKKKTTSSTYPSENVLPSSAHIFINDQTPADKSSSALLGNRNSPAHFRPWRSAWVSRSFYQILQVKTNMWQYAIIGTNWTTLYIQICCWLSTSRHVNNMSSDCLTLSDISANELVSATKSERAVEENSKLCFPLCNFSNSSESSLIRPI